MAIRSRFTARGLAPEGLKDREELEASADDGIGNGVHGVVIVPHVKGLWEKAATSRAGESAHR
jgi:hypothetical protein